MKKIILLSLLLWSTSVVLAQSLEEERNKARKHEYKSCKWMRKKNYQKALEEISKAIDLDPQYQYHLKRAYIYTLFKDYPKALEDYTLAIQFSPTQVTAYYKRGDMYLALKKYNLALKDYQEAHRNIRSKWNTTAYYGRMGDAYFGLNLYGKAEKVYGLKLKRTPSHIRSTFGLACIGAVKKDREEVLARLNSLVKYKRRLSSAHPFFLNNLARFATNPLFGFLHKDSQFTTVAQKIYFGLWETSVSTKKYLEGIKYAKELIELDQGSAQGYYARGVAYSGAQVYDKALADLTHSIQIDPSIERGDGYFKRGYVYRKMARWKKAERDYILTLLILRKLGPYLSLAKIYTHQKKFKKALYCLDRYFSNWGDTGYIRKVVARVGWNREFAPLKKVKGYDQLIRKYQMLWNLYTFAPRQSDWPNPKKVQKKFYDQIGYSRTILADYPKFYSVYKIRYGIHLRLKEHQKALGDLNKILELHPEDTRYYYLKGRLFRRSLMDLKKTAENFEKFLSMEWDRKQGVLTTIVSSYLVDYYKNTNPAKFFYYHGRLSFHPGYFQTKWTPQREELYQKAIHHFTKALKANPKMLVAYYRRGLLYLHRNQLDKAKGDFQKALSINSQYFPGHFALARVLVRQKEEQKGYNHLSLSVQQGLSLQTVYNQKDLYPLLNRREWLQFLERRIDRKIKEMEIAR